MTWHCIKGNIHLDICSILYLLFFFCLCLLYQIESSKFPIQVMMKLGSSYNHLKEKAITIMELKFFAQKVEKQLGAGNSLYLLTKGSISAVSINVSCGHAGSQKSIFTIIAKSTLIGFCSLKCQQYQNTNTNTFITLNGELKNAQFLATNTNVNHLVFQFIVCTLIIFLQRHSGRFFCFLLFLRSSKD